MKTRTQLTLAIAACTALIATTAAPADAAPIYTTTSISIPATNGIVATDTSTGTIYAGASAPQPFSSEGIATVAVLNGSTHKQTATIQVNQGPTGDYQPAIVDIKVRAATHTVWVLTAGYLGDGYVYEINGTTNKVVKTLPSGPYGTNLALAQTADTAYWSSAAQYNPTTPENLFGTPQPGKLIVNGVLHSYAAATGAQKQIAVPAAATRTIPWSEGRPVYFGYSVAFNNRDSSVMVAGGAALRDYTSQLTLARTTAFSVPPTDSLGATVDANASTAYVSDGAKLFSVNTTTGVITKTATYTTGGAPVIDPSIQTLYLGTTVISTSTLAKTGILPHPAEWVNGTTHTIYSGTTATIYVITRAV